MKIFKKYSEIIVLLLIIMAGFVFVKDAKAETYTYTATNFQTMSWCPLGAEFDRFGLTSPTSADVIKIVGTGFGINGDKIYLPTNEGTYWTNGDISTTDPGYLGYTSWNNSEINLKIRQGLGSSLGAYVILRPANSDGRNCIRGTLTAGLICSSFIYSDWSTCQSNSTQTRTTTSSSPNSCSGGDPVLTQSCSYIPTCTVNDYSCGDWNSCSVSGNKTRTCNKTSNCDGGVQMPTTSQSCTYTPPTCTSWTYSDWSSCSSGGNQTRSINSSLPNSCTGGSSILSQSCNYIPSCTLSDWTCASWGTCSQNGNQTRTCVKNSNCQGGVSSPATSQSCIYVAPVPSCTSFNYSSWSQCTPDGKQTRNVTYKYPYNCEGGESKTTQSCTYIPPAPTCDADIWTCGDWNSCSLSGIQNRSCRKTFDCSNVETAPPTTDQYCEAPNRPTQQIPQNSSDEISNQDTIIKATVKLLCLYDNGTGVQGSGTVIDSSGTILTNRHVVEKTLGCLVKFINNFNDTPNYDIRQIADIQKISSNEDVDVAILKLRNPQNRKLTSYIDITKANNNFRLGTKINIYGYPAIFGTKMTYTSGDFGGVDGNYLKTTAILEHGNSGGGAYLNNGMFIGIPTSVRKGELNALGYILSINTINIWLGNSSLVYNNSNNNYSRVSSILETIDLKKLGSIRQVIPGTKESKEIINKVTQGSSTIPRQIQKESTIIQPTDTNQKISPEQSNPTPVKKLKWYQKIFNWLFK